SDLDRLHGAPLGLLTYGHPMSREAYYLLVAFGVLREGSYTGDPYGDFQMIRYEDNKRRSYISAGRAIMPRPRRFWRIGTPTKSRLGPRLNFARQDQLP